MSEPLRHDDPAYWMLQRGRNEAWAVATGQITEAEATWVSKTTVYNDRCYICNDPEFALMGLPLCYPCKVLVNGVECGAHTPADDVVCDEGHESEEYLQAMEELNGSD
jgi:hypothetical protein